MPLTRDLVQHEALTAEQSAATPRLNFQHLPSSTNEVVKLREACLQTGFFVLDNAFESSTSIQQTIVQMQRFFSLPDDGPKKQAVCVDKIEGDYGWQPMFGEPAYQPGTVAHMESFDCGRDGADAWPDLQDFEADIRNCWDTLSAIGDTVLESLALASGMERAFLREHCATRELSTMRLLHYPQYDAPPEKKDVGIAAHTDFECMTLILQTAPGLELRTTGGAWIDAPSNLEQIVVLLGDMLERWTNGKFQATGHRVRTPDIERMSIVMFFAVNDGIEIRPLPAFVSDDSPERFGPIEQRKHLAEEVAQAEIYRDEALKQTP